MNPIAASGLISIGKSLLDNTLLKPNGIHSKPDGDAFKGMLEQAGGTQNDGISSVLSQYGVHSLSDMKQLRADLKRQLLDDPALAKVRVENPGASIHLVKTPDGSYQANLSNGKSISFVPGSETAQTAAALHQLSTFLGEGISTDHPGAITLAT
jgi:hypothetical protein